LVVEHFIMHKFSFTKGSLFKNCNAHLYECVQCMNNMHLTLSKDLSLDQNGWMQKINHFIYKIFHHASMGEIKQ
jgi:hypothetical protein